MIGICISICLVVVIAILAIVINNFIVKLDIIHKRLNSINSNITNNDTKYEKLLYSNIHFIEDCIRNNNKYIRNLHTDFKYFDINTTDNLAKLMKSIEAKKSFNKSNTNNSKANKSNKELKLKTAVKSKDKAHPKKND